MDFPASHVWLPEGTIMTFVGMSRFCWNRSLLLKRHGVGLLEAANRSQGLVLFWCRNPQTDSCCDFPLTVVHSDYIYRVQSCWWYIEFNLPFFWGESYESMGCNLDCFPAMVLHPWGCSLQLHIVPTSHFGILLAGFWLRVDCKFSIRVSGFGLDLNIFKHQKTKTRMDFSENKVQYPQIQWSTIVFPCFPHQNFMILRDTLHFQTDLFPSSATAGLTWRVSIRPSLCQCDSSFAFLHIMPAFGDGSKKRIRSHRFSRFIAGKIIKQFLGDFPTCLLTRG